MRDPGETALAFDAACAEAGVPYALLGGMAVLAWGQPRLTADVDAMVVLEPALVAALADALRRQGLRVDARDFHDAFRDRSHVTVFDDRTGFHVDVKLAFTQDEREQVQTAARVAYHDGGLSVARAEDTVAYKLSFGSPQDVADARGILARQEGRLDLARLRRVAGRLGVLSRLDQLLSELQQRR